jgi:hypothetical protein
MKTPEEILQAARLQRPARKYVTNNIYSFHQDTITHLIEKNWSYKMIATFLTQHGVPATAGGIGSYVKRERAKKVKK